MVEKIVSKVEDDLADVSELVKQEKPYAEKKLKVAMEEMGSSCSRYITLTQGKGGGGGAQAGRNKLDKERYRLCQREIVSCVFTMSFNSNTVLSRW